MSRLQEIKEEYAKHYAFNSWEELCQSVDSTFQLNEAVGDIARMYAEECARASLEKASENAEAEHHEIEIAMQPHVVKETITNPENIILL